MPSETSRRRATPAVRTLRRAALVLCVTLLAATARADDPPARNASAPRRFTPSEARALIAHRGVLGAGPRGLAPTAPWTNPFAGMMTDAQAEVHVARERARADNLLFEADALGGVALGSWTSDADTPVVGPAALATQGRGAGNDAVGRPADDRFPPRGTFTPWGEMHPAVEPRLTAAEIRAAVEGLVPALRQCREAPAGVVATADATVALRFSIDADGIVLVSEPPAAPGLPAAIGGCLAAALRTMRLPARPGAATVLVTYPFVMGRP